MTDSPPARPSSSVVVVRDAPTAPEIFMVRRHARSAFGNAFAFPGGVLDADDEAVETHCAGRADADACRSLQLDKGGLGYYVAAIRELFEETGILLAHCDWTADALADARRRINNNALTWREFLQASDARMLCNRLHYFSHWITPDHLPKRYSTRFFVAEMPGEQQAMHDAGELTDSTWISAADALRAGGDGSMKLHYPTQRTLESVAEHRSVPALVEWAASREAAGVATIHPVLADLGR